jgi:tetratricopeptide (TPR) repeat protein
MTLSVLVDWLSSLEHDLALMRLPLGSLSAEHTMQLVQILADEQSSDTRTRSSPLQSVPQEEVSSIVTRSEIERFGRWLFAETGGQPFFLMETLKALLERGVLIRRRSLDGTRGIDVASVISDGTILRGFLPSGVREVILTRLARLTSTAFRLLVAGAALGQRATFERLCQVAGLDETEGLSALDEILKARLWYETDQASNGHYLFAHDKIRDVVYTEAGDARRRIFHRRALEALRGTVSPAELAHHALAAGQIEPAFHLSMAAGDQAMHLFAVRDAIASYEQAWHLVERPGGDRYQLLVGIPPSDLQRLSVQLGRAYELTNEFEKARIVYQAMLAFAQESSTPTMECTALNRLATLAVLDRVDVEAAESFLQRAAGVAEQSGDPLIMAETEWNLAQVNYYSSNARTSLAHGKRALELARQLDQQELIARSLNVVAYASALLGQWEESERAASEARALYHILKNRAMEVDCLGEIAKVRICGGQAQAGMRAARDALTISTEIENTWGQAYSAFNLAMGALEGGDYAEALTFAQQAVTLARTHDLTMFLSASLTTLGRVHRTLLDVIAAQAAHLEALTLGEAQHTPWIEIIADELCTDCALMGRWADAHAYAMQALNTRGDSLYLYVGLTHWYKIEALVRAGDVESALEEVGHFAERIGDSRRHRIPYLRSLAVLAMSRGEMEKAAQHLQEAGALAEEIDLPGEQWSIQAAVGELSLIRDEQEQAQHAFKRAATMVRKLAENMGDEGMKANFLASPLVQRVLERSSIFLEEK